MTCLSCQQRREAILKIIGKAGTVVFGGSKRVLSKPQTEAKDGKPGT